MEKYFYLTAVDVSRYGESYKDIIFNINDHFILESSVSNNKRINTLIVNGQKYILEKNTYDAFVNYISGTPEECTLKMI